MSLEFLFINNFLSVMVLKIIIYCVADQPFITILSSRFFEVYEVLDVHRAKIVRRRIYVLCGNMNQNKDLPLHTMNFAQLVPRAQVAFSSEPSHNLLCTTILGIISTSCDTCSHFGVAVQRVWLIDQGGWKLRHRTGFNSWHFSAQAKKWR